MKFAAAAIILAGSPIFATGVLAADAVNPVTPNAEQIVTDDGWTFTLAPYFWAAGINGDIAQFGLPQVSVDANFDDIWNNLDFAAMMIGEARKDRYSFFGDIIYVKLGAESATPRGELADTASVTSSTFAGTFGGGYTLFQTDVGHLDVVGAGRIWNVDTEISFSGRFLDGVSRSDSATWVDGLVGLRGDYSFTPKVYFTGWGLVGAGGADLDWDVAGAIGYKFNDWFSAVAGYRALGVDYNDDGFEFNVVQSGPIFGAVFKF
jgi:hypothetical protein